MTTKIMFTLPAANIIDADECVLLGEFNNWNPDEAICLQKQPDGSMKAEVELASGKDYQYRYLLSNGRWVNDDAEKVIAEIMGYSVENCIVHVEEIITETTEQKTRSVKPKAVKAKADVKTKPIAKAKPVIVKEDLAKIEGIGKKVEALLFKNEIYTYKQLSKTAIKNLKEILAAGGSKFSMHNPGTWPKQAKLAADGKWEELALLQQQLKGGK